MTLRVRDLPPALAKRIGVKVSKPSKYHAERVWCDGIRFDSKREARRYQQLLLLVKAGEIDNVQIQPTYPIAVGDTAICIWRGDFRYRVRETGSWIVEDVKGVRTPVYKLKKKLVEAIYRIRIQEV